MRWFLTEPLWNKVKVLLKCLYQEKKKPAKKPTKTPEERFQWLDKNKDSGITIEELKVNPYWKKKPALAT